MVKGLLSTTANEEMPLIKELWLYFYDTYFNPNEYYEHINVGTGTILSIRVVILGMCIGLAIAGFIAVYNKRVIGELVRRLLKKQALSPDTALTLEELGYADNIIMRRAVRKNVALRRVVKCVEEQRYDEELQKKREEYENKRREDSSLSRFKETEYKIDVENDRFYIPEKMKYTADIKFEKKGTTLVGAIVFSFVMVFVFFALIVALPHILELINELLGAIKG